MNELISIDKLKDHPKNTYYFDDVVGGKWEELLNSIKTSGVYEKIIITPDRTIVSGHQRVRACRELGIKEIKYEMLDFENEDEIVKCLIETNTKQRGTVADSDLKQGRRYLELERIYGIKNGRPKKLPNCSEVKSQSQLATENGCSVDTWNNKKNLTKLIPELQQLMLNKKLTTKIALIYSAMPPEEQLEIYNEIGEEKITEMNYEKTKIELYNIKKQNEQLQQELQREKSKPARVETKVIEKVIDKTNYSLVDKIKEYEVKISQMNNKIAILEEEDVINTKLVNDCKQEVEEFKRYKERLLGMNAVKGGDYDEVKILGDIDELYLKIHGLIINDLSPVKYSGCMRFINNSKYINESFNTLLNSVQEWCDDMRRELNQNENIITVEVN